MTRKPSPPARAKPEIDALIEARRHKRFQSDATTLADDLRDLWPGVTPLDVHRYCNAPLKNADEWARGYLSMRDVR